MPQSNTCKMCNRDLAEKAPDDVCPRCSSLAKNPSFHEGSDLHRSYDGFGETLSTATTSDTIEKNL